VKRCIHLALVFGALIGLFSQAVAYAHTPAPQAPQREAMSEDCMEMMNMQPPTKRQMPCKGMTLDCIAAMGCTVPMVLGEPFEIGPSTAASIVAPWEAAPVPLSGRSIPPDPDPPSLI
jgi:hypothetical protein